MVCIPRFVQSATVSAHREGIRAFRILIGFAPYFEIICIIIGLYGGATILYVNGYP